MNYREELIGRNVSLRRGHLSQQAVADQMREFGYKWSQATVWAIEKGERPLRLAEAVDLARVLDIDVDDLLVFPTESRVLRARDKTRLAEKIVVEAVAEYLGERYILQRLLDEEDIGEAVRRQATAILSRTLEDAIQRGAEQAREYMQNIDEMLEDER